MVATTRCCLYCKNRFTLKRRGRPGIYCCPSHRVRAHENRKLLEIVRPTEKHFRLLKERLASLARQRIRNREFPELELLRRDLGAGRPSHYQRAADKVREILIEIAPEVFKDIREPWRGALAAIEADTVVDRGLGGK